MVVAAGLRRLRISRGDMALSWMVCRRARSSWALSSDYHKLRISQQSSFAKIQLKQSAVIDLCGLRNKVTFTGQPSSWTTVDPKEMKNFQRYARTWWDENGISAPLHSMNHVRVPFIRDSILSMKHDHRLGSPLFGMEILDIGCGGGLLTEPLCRLGASVTGIDPLKDNIQTAELHKSFDPVLAERIQYRACTLEDIVEEASEKFDVIVASEVVEHVVDLENFMRCFAEVLKPAGSAFITTVNRTQLSYISHIVLAERLLGLIPLNTHEWEKFITPEELECLLESNGFKVKTVKGMLYNPLFRSWSWIESTSGSYAIHAVKTSMKKQQDHKTSTDDQQTEAST